MSFNPDTHNVIEMKLDTVEARLAVWIKDHRNAIFNADVASVLTMHTGRSSLQLNLNAHDANILIEALHQYVANIKAAEIELLALSAKAAA